MLRLTFARRLLYARGEGFRTTDLALPFKVLAGLKDGENRMARLDGESSNTLFEALGELERHLAQLGPEGLRCGNDKPSP